MKNPTNGGRRGRHRRRWTATSLLLGVPAIVVPYLLFTQEDSQAATVDGDAYYRLVSVRSGKVLDVNAFSTADGTRIQQWTDQSTANQQWKLRATGDGHYELMNRNSGKVLGIAGNSTARAAAAEQQTDSSSASQEWRIDDVSGSGTGHWMTALAIDPFNSGHVLYGTGSGIWRSKDATATDSGGTSHWTVGAQGLEETALQDAVAPPGGATVVTAMGDLGGFRHDSLTEVRAGRLKNPMMITSTDIDFAQSDPALMVRVGRGGEKDGAYSTDGGSSWTGFKAEPVGSADSGQVALAADGSAIVWTDAGQAPYRSTDKGATWLRVNDDAHQWGSIGSTGVITGDPDTFGRVYVGTNGRGLQYGDPS